MQRDVPYLDINQVNEHQLYYDASAVSVSSGSACEEPACDSPNKNITAENLGRDGNNEVTRC